MKRLIAISLLSLHLLSLNAGIAVHIFSTYLSDRFFEKQTSLGLYNKQDLTEIKLQVNMPQISDWAAYENISGEVRFANTAYNYVKIKVTRNAIYLLCVPNYKTTHLCGQNIIHAEKMSDIPVHKKDHVPFEKTFNLSAFNHLAAHRYFFLPVLVIDDTSKKIAANIVRYPIPGPRKPPQFIV